MIGMTYAARHPERIARLVVMNTAAFHMPRAKSLPWALGVCRDTPIGSWVVRGLNAFARGTAVIGCTRKRLPRAVAKPMWLPTIPGAPDRDPPVRPGHPVATRRSLLRPGYLGREPT